MNTLLLFLPQLPQVVFLVSIPVLAIWKKIAEHISAIRKEAQQLKDKTKEELKKASKEIEKILLTQ